MKKVDQEQFESYIKNYPDILKVQFTLQGAAVYHDFDRDDLETNFWAVAFVTHAHRWDDEASEYYIRCVRDKK